MEDEGKTTKQRIKELLELHQRIVELEKSETERKRVEKALRESEEKYRTIFETTGTATVIIEEDTTLSLVNTEFERLSGYSRKELEGKKSWTAFVVKDDLDRMKEYHRLRRIAPSAAPKNYEFRFIDRQGNLKDIFLTVATIPGTKQSIASLLDITERKRAKERIEHLNLVLRAIRGFNQLITREKERDRLLSGVCKILTKTGGYYSVWNALLDESGELLTYAEAGLGKDFLPVVERLKRGELTACGQRALKQSAVVIIEDPSSVCTECPLADKCNGKGIMTVRLEHGGKVYGLLSASCPAIFTAEEQEQTLLKEVTNDIALALHDIELEGERRRVEEELKQSYEKLQRSLEGAIQAMASIVEARDPYTAGHQRRVTQLACAIAREMNLPEEQIEAIRVAGTIHDIGKIYVPAEILSKPGRLTENEFAIIKTHPQVGYEILKTIEFPWPIAQIVLQHHETMDGSGYPQGLSGEDILLEAGILRVADVVEAMSSHRPYRPAPGIDKALFEILQNKGCLYDSNVVDACLQI